MKNPGVIEKPTNIIRVIIGTYVYEIEEEETLFETSLLKNANNINVFANNQTENNGKSYDQIISETEQSFVSMSSLENKEVNLEFSEIINTDTELDQCESEVSKNITDAKPYLNVSLFKKIENNLSIQRAKILKNVLYLYFATVTDALIFYSENKCNHSMSFENKYAFDREKSELKYYEEMVNVEVNRDICPKKMIIKQKKIKVLENINNGNMSLESNSNYMKNEVFNEFNDRIVLFGTIFKKISNQELESIEESFKQGDFDCILKNAKELCVGVQSNIFMQDVLKSINQDQLKFLIDELEYDIGPISATKYGAYVIQTILNLVATPNLQKLVVHYFEKYASLLISHPLGNYSIQTLKKYDRNFFISLILDNFEPIIQTNIGLKVFKKSIDLFENTKDKLEYAVDQCEEPLRTNLRKIIYKEDQYDSD
ncbi:hypothetical protein TUBRATIS_25910 [Tubulinosema ratisbonensis]|uniref:Uncharacterized protein n=1 Tax=Tubulinosema ratisbonensis TaxID=291195 RepID=A0A437AII8_9MICR|nr:hypothetical protein TUBRATIS_25910 [Tubulinosema ratisbonensis]